MEISGWGRYPRIKARTKSFEIEKEIYPFLEESGDWISRGMGKSYGDSSLNTRVICSGRFNKILDFDSEQGIVICESGVSLAELIDVFLPRGWFLSVTPGTKLISVGGAIASDVHGKNHHVAGCFSSSVESMEIMLADGSIVSCCKDKNQQLFRATCGGMGLTGIILRAALKLQPVKSAFIRETIIKCKNLEEVFTRFEEYRSTSYSVAWIDCLAKGSSMGRSVLMMGEHAKSGRLVPPPERSLSIPIDFPGFCLNKYSISLFNSIYYKSSPGLVKNKLTALDPFFYPLDKIGNWNRMYGRSGFTQYQFVLPKEASFKGLTKILKKITEKGYGSFLAVLKLFGSANDNMISFPMEGYTLALDFKIRPGLFPLLEELDHMVIDHGGRIYLTKDVRMTRETFIKGYANWSAFAEIREKYKMNKKFNSLQSKRLGV